MNRTFDFEIESKMNQSDSNFHTSIKPYTISSLSSGNINIEEGGSSFFLNKIIEQQFFQEKGVLYCPFNIGIWNKSARK